MPDLNVEIKLENSNEDIINDVDFNKSVNNASMAVGAISERNQGQPLLSFAKGYVKFNESGNIVNYDGTSGNLILENSYNGFVFPPTNNNGELSLTISLQGNKIDSVIVCGDKLANQYPIEGYLDGDTENKIYSDDYEWAIKFAEEASTHTITFTKWNRANYNACITYLGVLANNIVLNKRWISTAETQSQILARNDTIQYGLLPSSGSLEIIDRNGELYDYVADGILPDSNVYLSFKIGENQISNHLATIDSYDKSDKTLAVTLSDYLERIGSETADCARSLPSTEISNNTASSYIGFSDLFGLVSGYFGIVPHGSKFWRIYSGIGLSVRKYDDNNIIDVTLSPNVRTIIGFPLKVTPYKKTQVQFNNIHVGSSTILVKLQVLDDVPDNGDNLSKEIASEEIYGDPDTMGVEFTPKTERVYVVFNFAYDTSTNSNFTFSVGNARIENTTPIHYRFKFGDYSNTDLPRVFNGTFQDWSVGNIINSIAKITQTTGIVDSNGDFKMLSARNTANQDEYDDPIVISAKDCKSYLEESFTSAYKCDGIKTKVKKLNKTDNVIYTSSQYALTENGELISGIDYYVFQGTKQFPWIVAQFNIRINFSDLGDKIYYFDRPIKIITKKNISTSASDSSALSKFDYAPTQEAKVGSFTTHYDGKSWQETDEDVYGITYDDKGFDLKVQVAVNNYNEYPGWTAKDVTIEIQSVIPLYEETEEDIITGKNPMEVDLGELCRYEIGYETNIGSTFEPLYEIDPIINKISDNFKSDFSQGIKTAKVTIVGRNYYRKGGTIAKQWSKGEIINIGDIVRVDKDNSGTSASVYKDGTPRLWKVIGREYSRQGVSEINLELIEIPRKA